MAKRGSTERDSVSRIENIKGRQEEENHVLLLSTGVKLKLQQVPIMLPTEIAMESMKDRPKPPVVFIQDLDRSDENPDDPDYKEALQEWQARVLLDMNNAFILLGTVPAFVPRGFPPQDDPGFLMRMAALHRDTEGAAMQYLAWVKYCAAPTTDDIAKIIAEVGRLSGVAESDVRAAVEGFQR